DFLRNRIRHDLMPAARAIEPDVEERIFRTVTLIQDEFEYFQGQAQALLEANLLPGAILPAPAFAGLHPAVARHLAREYLRRLKGNLLGVGYEHIAGFLQSLETGRGLSLPGLNLKFAKGWVFPEKIRIDDYRLEITGRGSWSIAGIGLVLTLRRTARFRKPADNLEIVVPERKLRFPLRARPARGTDKYRKIHSPYRQSVFDGEIIWSCGSPLAAPFAADDVARGPFVRITLAP
ncbi:MAG: hypothetical protein MUF02_10005, partial [Acidobacteria bacterium]|nr:hypothetical protein [Acidobacteriota bacterium]